jgi:hypothetical protein
VILASNFKANLDEAFLRRFNAIIRFPFPEEAERVAIWRTSLPAQVQFEDGSYGLVDYKTSDARDEHAAFYSRQLSAYAYSLEHPASGALSFAPVKRLGLFIITPDRFEPTAAAEMAFVTYDVGGGPATMTLSLRCWATCWGCWMR